jgi:hypothetical protein
VTEEVRIAVLEEQVKNARIELARQAGEYERRLTELNHSASARATLFQIIGQIISVIAIAAIVWSKK